MRFLLLTITLLSFPSPYISARSGCAFFEKCHEGQGDCDRNSHCHGRLKCGRNNCGSGYDYGYDCCYDPAKRACLGALAGVAAGTGTCAAISGALCGPTFGIGCIVSIGCGVTAATTGASTAACRKKRSAVEPSSQEELLMQSSDFDATLQQLQFRNARESLEDWALGSIDLTSLVRGTGAEQSVREILRVDEAYKSLDKTPQFELLKENDPAVERFGQTAIEILIPQTALSRFLSGNSTLYGGPKHNCGMATVNAFEALLIKGTVYYFLGQEIVDETGPSQDQIDEQKALLQAHQMAYLEHCSHMETVIDTDKNKRASAPLKL